MYHSMILQLLPCVPLLLLCSQTVVAQLQRGVSPRVLKSVGDKSCVAEDQLEAVHSRVRQQVQGIIEESIAPKLCQSGLYENIPADSCRDIHQDCPSGYYWLNVPNGDPLRTYCTGPPTRTAAVVTMIISGCELAISTCLSQMPPVLMAGER